jgi:dTDP-4-amino-4,6-dideoxygalactose transaminase
MAGLSLPISERIHEQVLSLPIGPQMSAAHVERVLEAVRGAVREAAPEPQAARG